MFEQKNTWLNNYIYKESFFERLEYLFSFIDFDKVNSIMDLGCGNQWAKKLLPDRIKYFPIDLYKTNKNTIVLDFNKGEFLNQNVDLALCSGIIEYIYNVENFIQNIKNNSNYVICSYHFKEKCTKRSSIWVNNIEINEFLNIFYENKFELQMPIIHTDRHDGESYCFFKKIGLNSILKTENVN